MIVKVLCGLKFEVAERADEDIWFYHGGFWIGLVKIGACQSVWRSPRSLSNAPPLSLRKQTYRNAPLYVNSKVRFNMKRIILTQR